MQQANSTPLNQFAMFNFALCVGGAFFAGHGLVNSFILLTPLSIYVLYANGRPELSRSAISLSILCLVYYFYFSWRELASPYHLPRLDFIRENFPFLVAPLIIMAFGSIDVGRTFRWMAQWLPFLLAATVIGSAWQKGFDQDFRAYFTADNPLSLAMFAISGIYISLANYRDKQGRWNLPIIGLILFFGFILIIYLADSRNATVLYLICGGIFLVYWFCSVEYSWRRNIARSLSIALIGVLALSLTLYLIVSFNLMPRLTGLWEFVKTGQRAMDDSTFHRVVMWREFLDHWHELPKFGAGPEDLFGYFRDHFGTNTSFRHFHNDFINHFVAGGYIGALLYLALLLTPIAYLFHPNAREDRFLLVVIITFIVFAFSGLTNRIMFHPERVAWYVYLLMFIQIYFDHLVRKSRGDVTERVA